MFLGLRFLVLFFFGWRGELLRLDGNDQPRERRVEESKDEGHGDPLELGGDLTGDKRDRLEVNPLGVAVQSLDLPRHGTSIEENQRPRAPSKTQTHLLLQGDCLSLTVACRQRVFAWLDLHHACGVAEQRSEYRFVHPTEVEPCLEHRPLGYSQGIENAASLAFYLEQIGNRPSILACG